MGRSRFALAISSCKRHKNLRLIVNFHGLEKSFIREGEILERGLRKALRDRDEALRDLAAAARWVDRSAFGKEEGFAQAHQALLKALDKAGQFV